MGEFLDCRDVELMRLVRDMVYEARQGVPVDGTSRFRTTLKSRGYTLAEIEGAIFELERANVVGIVYNNGSRRVYAKTGNNAPGDPHGDYRTISLWDESVARFNRRVSNRLWKGGLLHEQDLPWVGGFIYVEPYDDEEEEDF